MRTTLAFLLLGAGALAQDPIAVQEERKATRLVWVAEVARPVEVRIDYGTATWREEYAAELGQKSEATFRLGSGAWATLHASADLRWGTRTLPAGIWYLALHRDAEAKWSLAILDATKICRQGVLPGGARDVKPSMLVPLAKQQGLAACSELQVTLAAAATPGAATLSLRWGGHELSTSLAAAIEPEPVPAAHEFRQLDAARSKTTASGLRYEELRPGVGRSPAPTDTVRVHYTGWLTDGTRFDSSLDRKQPITFRLDQVIKGWTEGLQQMAPGAMFLLEIPPDLGYGARGAGAKIPPDSTLVFLVELIAVQ